MAAIRTQIQTHTQICNDREMRPAYTHVHLHKDTDRQIDRQTERQTDRHTHTYTGTDTHTHTHRQTDMHTHTVQDYLLRAKAYHIFMGGLLICS